MLLTFTSIQDLISTLESKAAEARSKIGKTRTKLESHELKGEVYAFNEAIFYVKEYAKDLERKNGSPDTMEPVDSTAS